MGLVMGEQLDDESSARIKELGGLALRGGWGAQGSRTGGRGS